VLLVDDHDVVRAGLRSLIAAEADLEVVGEASSAAEAVRRVGFDEPDVVVLDVRLPDRSGVEACKDIRARFPAVRVLILTSFADEEALLAAILAGASGFALKRVRSNELIEAIRRIAAGESLLDPATTRDLLARIGADRTRDPVLARLSSRERVILHHIADGKSNRQIAKELYLAEKTVKNYVSNLLTKMGMQRRTEAAAYLARATAPEEYPPEAWPEDRPGS